MSAKANEEMRLYNLTMKVNRLEMLKANIGLELIAGHQELEDFMGGILKGRTMDELKRQGGILGKTVSLTTRNAEALVNADFKHASFSDRIWMYQDAMKNDLAKLLQSGLIQGKNPRVLAKELEQKFKTESYQAERLMRTELQRVQTEAQRQSFKRNGWTLYEFIVNRGCCDICAGLDGKHFSVDKMEPGRNAPPMHPNCRCATAPWEDSEEYDAWLDYLDKGGTTEKWNATEKAKWKSQRRHQNKLENSQNGGKIGTGRGMANGERMSVNHFLTEPEIQYITGEAEAIGIPKNKLRFNAGKRTSYIEELDIIAIRGDILPDEESTIARDKMSVRAVLAHEYYGHRPNVPSEYKPDDWRDEFRASYDAAVNAPNLTDEDRANLMVEAYDRAREANNEKEYDETARRIIYGY